MSSEVDQEKEVVLTEGQKEKVFDAAVKLALCDPKRDIKRAAKDALDALVLIESQGEKSL